MHSYRYLQISKTQTNIFISFSNDFVSLSEFVGKRSFLIEHSEDNLYYKGFNLQFQTKTQQIHEEYLLYDITGAIGSIGGTLGLFIGFSFRDTIAILLDKIKNIIIKNPWNFFRK